MSAVIHEAAAELQALRERARTVQGAPAEPFALKRYSGMPDVPAWTFGGLLEAGTCAVLAAEPKAGKSWFTFDAGICLATGERLLGEWAPAVRGTTLYYSPEGGHRSRHARLVGLCRGRNLDPEAVLPSLPFVDARVDLAAEGHAARLGATIDACGARLVVIDPMVSAAVGIDENASGDIMRVLNPLRDMIAERPHCSLIVVHHTNKGARSQAMSLGLRGSSAIMGWLDTLITIRRAEDDSGGPRRIDVAHRDAAAPEPMGFRLDHAPLPEDPAHQWFRLASCEVPDLAGGNGRPGRRLDPDLLASIEELVRNHPGQLTRGGGAAALDVPRPTFNRHFTHLEDAGALGLGPGGKMVVKS